MLSPIGLNCVGQRKSWIPAAAGMTMGGCGCSSPSLVPARRLRDRATRPVAAPPAYAWATFDAHGLTASGASGLADRAARRRLTDRGSGADRLHLQAGRRDRGDAAGRAGAARSRPRRLRLSRLAAAQSRLSRTGRSRSGCCCRTAPRCKRRYRILGDSARRDAASGRSPTRSPSIAEHAAGRLFPLLEPQFPGDRLGDGEGDRRAVRRADGAAGAAAAGARRLLQLVDLRRRRDRARGRALPRRTAR